MLGISGWDSDAQVPLRKFEDPTPGRIIERVVCRNNSEQTYALYLPSNYSYSQKWPLIAAFDPGARGNLPVEHFREAAERYGFIVCGSNNSRNGPMPPTGEAAKAMLGDGDKQESLTVAGPVQAAKRSRRPDQATLSWPSWIWHRGLPFSYPATGNDLSPALKRPMQPRT